jgi:NADH:ubiquinone oxidoreductase subunit E
MHKKKLKICRGNSCKKADPEKVLKKTAKRILKKNQIKKTNCLGLCKSAFAVKYHGKIHSCPEKKDLEKILLH